VVLKRGKRKKGAGGGRTGLRGGRKEKRGEKKKKIPLGAGRRNGDRIKNSDK